MYALFIDWPARNSTPKPCVSGIGLPCLNDGQEVIAPHGLDLFFINHTGPCPHNMAIWAWDRDNVTFNHNGVFLWVTAGWLWDFSALGFGPLFELEFGNFGALLPYMIYFNAGNLMASMAYCPASGTTQLILLHLEVSSDSLAPGYTLGFHADSGIVSNDPFF